MLPQLIFDLDDTLIKSDHIFDQFLETQRHWSGFDQLIRGLSGRPYYEIRSSIERSHGDEVAKEFVSGFLEWYDTEGWMSHKPFEGVEEALNEIVERSGGDIVVVTNKRTCAAVRVLELLFPRIGFSVEGVDAVNTTGKSDILRRVRSECLSPKHVYVGDTVQDFRDAGNAGISFAGARWCERPVEFPTIAFESPTDLVKWWKADEIE